MTRPAKCFYRRRARSITGIIASGAILRRNSCCGILNSRVCDFYHHRVAAVFRGGWFSYESRFIHNFPIPTANPAQMAAIEGLVTVTSLFFKRQPSVRQSAPVHPRDPLIAEYFEQWLNAMVYELFFPEDVQTTYGSDFFTLFSEARLPSISDLEEGRLTTLSVLALRNFMILLPLSVGPYSLCSHWKASASLKIRK